MSAERDDLRGVVLNSSDEYSEIFRRRGLKFIRQYVTKELEYPTSAQIADLFLEKHLWTLGDKYWKLAATYYKDSELWWVIAWFNAKPTDAHVRAGDIIYIPHPLEKVYNYFGL